MNKGTELPPTCRDDTEAMYYLLRDSELASAIHRVGRLLLLDHSELNNRGGNNTVESRGFC